MQMQLRKCRVFIKVAEIAECRVGSGGGGVDEDEVGESKWA